MNKPTRKMILLLAAGLCMLATGGAWSLGARAVREGTSAARPAAIDGRRETLVAAPSGWGNLQGRFTIAGAPPPAKVEIVKDEAYCGKFQLVDESLVVGQGGGLANVVVFLSLKRGETVPTHESYAASADATVVLDNFQCRFVPRVVLLRATQTLAVTNSDPGDIAHNAKIDGDPPINIIIAPGRKITHKFKAQRLPATVSCSIHPWMIGRLVVKDTPYMAVTDKQGAFAIENLPAGKWQFVAWHERLGLIAKVDVDDAAQEWTRGQFAAEIQAGASTDLGELKLDYANYP
jgi:hypothetical protein